MISCQYDFSTINIYIGDPLDLVLPDIQHHLKLVKILESATSTLRFSTLINNLSHFTMSNSHNRSSLPGEQYDDQTQPPPPYSAHAPQQGSKQPPLPYPNDDSESFGPPQRQESFGPPVTGGFQHGYEGGQFGTYDASNPQGHMGYLYDS